MQTPSFFSPAPMRLIRGAATLAPVLLAATLAGCGASNAQSAPPPPQIPVATPLVQKVSPTRQYPGRVEAVDRVELRPRVSGYIEEILFAEGALVERGEPLLRIDARSYRARLKQAEAALALARAEQKLALQEHERARRLVERNAIAAQELDRRAAAVEAACARLAAAEAARELAALELSWTEISAPITGRIGRAEVTTGNLVSAAAGGGTLLAVLVSTDPVYVGFDVDEATAARAGTGGEHALPVRFAAAGISHEAIGDLAFVDNELGHGTGTLRIRARLRNTDGALVPGMLGRITFGVAEASDALLVDEKAIGTDQGRRFVLVAGADGALEYRPVETGPAVGALRIVSQGLAPTDQVVVNGLMRVRPGAVIQPVRVSMERAAAGDYTPSDTSVVAVAE